MLDVTQVWNAPHKFERTLYHLSSNRAWGSGPLGTCTCHGVRHGLVVACLPLCTSSFVPTSTNRSSTPILHLMALYSRVNCTHLGLTIILCANANLEKHCSNIATSHPVLTLDSDVLLLRTSEFRLIVSASFQRSASCLPWSSPWRTLLRQN